MNMSNEMILWIVFAIVVPVVLIIDLGIFNRRAHEIKIREALLLCLFWIALALSFNLLILLFLGKTMAVEFLTGYLIEESLSVDNLFVFLLIFSYFQIPHKYQHKVLFWGILGVIVTRGIFIFAGVALIQRIHWLIYVFGAFLVLTGIKMAVKKDEEIHPEKNPVLRIARKLFPVTSDYREDKFFVRELGKLFVTPLFIALLVVESTDVVFAVDSIPAIFGITTDPFIVYTSNIFAVLGLRALFFALEGVMRLFHHLHYGLSAILAFIGVKMLISGFFKIDTVIALGIVAGILVLSVITSIIWPEEKS